MILFILCIWVLPYIVCLPSMCVPAACESQKRVSNALELQLWIVVSHHVGVGNRTQVVWKSGQYSLSSEPALQLS